MQLGNLFADVFSDHGISGWQAILGLAVMALYAQLVGWNVISDRRAQRNIAKMENTVESQNLKIELANKESGDAKVEARNAKLEAKAAKFMAAMPCHLLECPKRTNPPSMSFSINENPPSSEGAI